MNLDKFFACDENEKPLDNCVTDGGFGGIFRTIAVVGDSMSSGEFQSYDEDGKVGFHDYYEYSWGQYLAREAGCTVYNFSRGGMSAKWYLDTFADEKGFWRTELAAQGYIIALGANDLFYTDIEFGDISDIDLENCENNKETFVGCYAKIIQKYKKIQPKAKFFLVTLPSDQRANRNEKKREHRDLLYKLAEIFDNTYIIDLFEYAVPFDDDFKKKFFLDGHMNAVGYQIVGKMFASYIDYIIRHNMDDFRQIGFIGTPYYNTKYEK